MLSENITCITMDELEQLCSDEKQEKVSEMKLFKIYFVLGDNDKINMMKKRFPFLIWKEAEKESSIFPGETITTNICSQWISWKELKKLIKADLVKPKLHYQHCSLMLNRKALY